MGYSESLLRRLVDKIHDVSLNTVDYDLNPARVTTTTTQREVQGPLAISSVDLYDDAMPITDDHICIESPTPPTMEVPTRRTDILEDSAELPISPDYGQFLEPSDPNNCSLAEVCTYQLISFLDKAEASRKYSLQGRQIAVLTVKAASPIAFCFHIPFAICFRLRPDHLFVSLSCLNQSSKTL
jgi:hypothetical protein